MKPCLRHPSESEEGVVLSGVEMASGFLQARGGGPWDGGLRTQVLGLEGVKLLLEGGAGAGGVDPAVDTHLDTEVVSISIHAGGQPL